MKNKISVTPDAVVALRNVIATVNDDCEATQHDRAARRYREERQDAAPMADEPWWVDVGGEGEPC